MLPLAFVLATTPFTVTSPLANPPLQVSVVPCDRVIDAKEPLLVKVNGVCTSMPTLKLSMSFPPEPVNV
jgi:hypothetical protein